MMNMNKDIQIFLEEDHAAYLSMVNIKNAIICVEQQIQELKKHNEILNKGLASIITTVKELQIKKVI